MEWRAGGSRRLRNSFVRLLDRELCPFQVRGGGVGRLSSSSIATAMARQLTTYVAGRSSVCHAGWQLDRRACGWWRACRYLLSGGGYGHNQLYYGCAHRPILQSAIGGPPTRVGGWEFVVGLGRGDGDSGLLEVGQRWGDVWGHVRPRE